MTVTQLRLVLETDDLDAALAFYRDALGLTELEAYAEGDGSRVHILAVPTATIELSNPQQVRHIDRVETGAEGVAHAYPLTVRLAFEVPDAVAADRDWQAAGARPVAPPAETPWRSLNARLEAPGGMQVTAFQELG
jgi:lactoylglutathione lyase